MKGKVLGHHAQEKEIEAIEKKIHHLEKEVHILMEHQYTHHHHPFYGAWGIRGLDWYAGE